MIRVGVVIPTITARADMARDTIAAYHATRPFGVEYDLVVIHDRPTVGEAWNAGAGYITTAEYLHFAIDDAVPHDGWIGAALTAVRDGYMPAARIMNPDGSVQASGSMGNGAVIAQEVPDGLPVRCTGIPFMTRDVWDRIGPFAPIHYYVDDDYGHRLAAHGIPLGVARGYTFTHHDVRDPAVIARAADDFQTYRNRTGIGARAVYTEERA